MILPKFIPHANGQLWGWLMAIALGISSFDLNAQELEPRALTNVPIGMNFLLAGYGYSTGDINLDPSLPLEDFKANVHSLVLAYARSINFFGMSGKIDAVLPYAFGSWTGVYQGQNRELKIDGFGDLRLRFSFNFLGAPALRLSEYKKYQFKTVMGTAIQVTLPTGKYYPDKLPNLGSNRITTRIQLGISQLLNRWIVEGYASLWIIGDNNDFWGGNSFAKDPMVSVKVHAIRTLKKGNWVALDVGYGYGARSYINGDARDAMISTVRLGFTFALPVGRKHILRLVGISDIRLAQGTDFDLLSFLYQYRWGGKP